MKIAVCGKGGSGKSTVIALLSQQLRQRGRRVLVVDSDESNSGLHWMLGFEQPPRPLLELVGGKKHVQRAMRTQFTTGDDEPEISVLARSELGISDLPPGYVAERNGLGLVTVGKIHQALEGCACPMGVLSREFLKKLRLADNEIALVDMEAGIEHFGRGVETSIDAIVVVVEPSLEALVLGEKVRQLASGAGAGFAGAILNKISADELVSVLTAELDRRQIPVLATIRQHDEIVTAGLAGRPPDSAEAEREAAVAANALLGRDASDS